MEELTIEVARREGKGKNDSRRLRAAGKFPAVVYGGHKESVPVTVERAGFLELMRKTGSENAVYLLKLAGSGQSRHVMIKDMDVNPITRQIRHVDFQRILMTEKVRVHVQVSVVGVPVGVKTEGGMLDFVTREIEVECLPGDIPTHLDADVSALHIGQHLEARQLPLPDKVTLVEDPERVILAIAQPRLAAEEDEETAEDLLLEAEPEEPEVIGRTREGEEDEG